VAIEAGAPDPALSATSPAVDDVSYPHRQGEIFGFLGSNGCGKTTTMKMLTGLLVRARAARGCSAGRSTRPT